MAAYLVRKVATKGVLGLFVAPNLCQLQWSIDAIGADPGDYEYRPVTYGSIAFYGPHEPVYDRWHELLEVRAHSPLRRARAHMAALAFRIGFARLASALQPPALLEDDFWNGAESDEHLWEHLNEDRWRPLPYAGEPRGILSYLSREVA